MAIDWVGKKSKGGLCTFGVTGGRKGGPVVRFLVTPGLRCDSPALTCSLYGRCTGVGWRAGAHEGN